MLEDVRGSPLIALIERGDHRFLFLASPCVSHLKVALISLLPDAGVNQIRMILFAQAGEHSSTGTERVIRGARFCSNSSRILTGKRCIRRLDLVVQDDIEVVELGAEVRRSVGSDGDRVGHAIRGKNARREP